MYEEYDGEILGDNEHNVGLSIYLSVVILGNRSL
jgi:hypothetical protein